MSCDMSQHLIQGDPENIQRSHTYKCYNTVLNCSRWLVADMKLKQSRPQL